MSGSKLGGQHAAATTKLRHGETFFARIGQVGGSTPTTKPKGFAAMPRAKVSAAGKRGGANSKRRPSTKSKGNVRRERNAIIDTLIEDFYQDIDFDFHLERPSLWGRIKAKFRKEKKV